MVGSSIIQEKEKLVKMTTRCHSFFTRCHSLSLFVTRCTTHCHSLYHLLTFVVTYCTTRFHSLSIDPSLVCLFINDPCKSLKYKKKKADEFNLSHHKIYTIDELTQVS